MYDLYELLDRTSNEQKIAILFKLHENPPTHISPVGEALSTFNALTDVEVFQFITEIKQQVEAETWELMV